MCEKNIVLSLDHGINFPPRPKGKLVVQAKLDNVLLQTDQILLQSERNPKIECELVWETSKSLLTSLRTRRACIKAEVFLNDDLLGYLILDLRSAPAVKVNSPAPPNQEYQLQGAKCKPAPCVSASLFIEIEEVNLPQNITQKNSSTDKFQIHQKSSTNLKPDVPQPILVESEGYFQIGDKSESELYQFKVAVLKAENLHLLLDGSAPKENQDFAISYELLGTELLAQPGELATAKIRASKSNLFTYFSSYSIQMNIGCSESLVGSVDVDVAEKCKVWSQCLPLQYTGDLPVIAAYNLTTPRDANNQHPYLSVYLLLDKLGSCSSPSAVSHQSVVDMSHISEGELSDAVSETRAGVSSSHQNLEANTSLQNCSQQQNDVQPVQSAMKMPGDDIVSTAKNVTNNVPKVQLGVQSAFKRMGNDKNCTTESITQPQPDMLPEGPDHSLHSQPPPPPLSPPTKLPRASSVLPGDETDYKSPPFRSSSTTPTLDYPKDVKLPRKLIISVESVRMLKHVTDLSIWYEYRHLSSSRISTSAVCAPAGDLVKILDGTMEYNFMSSQVQLAAVFTEYKLKLVVSSPKQPILGTCTLELQHILLAASDRNKVQKENFELTVVSEKGVIGYINVILSLQTFSPRHSPPCKRSLEHSLTFNSDKRRTPDGNKRGEALQQKENIPAQSNNQKASNLKSNSTSRHINDRLLEMEMLAQVAKELETWKINEQKKFKEQLVQKEKQQMSLLGREWQDRERTRVQVYNNKLEALQNRELEVDNKSLQLQAKEKELDEMKKSLEDEQTKLKQGRMDSLQKVKRELKNKETENLQLNTDLKLAHEKISTVEKELKEIKSEKGKKKDSLVALQNEIRKNREEFLNLQSQLQIRSKELQLMESQRDQLFKENQDLKTVQQNRLQELVTQLTKSKEIIEPAVIQESLLLPEINETARLSNRTIASTTCSTRTPTTQVERLKPATSGEGGMSEAGSGSSTSRHHSTQATPRHHEDRDQVKILRDIQRLERDRDMMLRAGHPHNDHLIKMFQQKIQSLYLLIKDSND